MTIPEEPQDILSADLEIMGGAICFTGTRIPVVMLFQNVAAGVPMDEFYDGYPNLTPDLVAPV